MILHDRKVSGWLGRWTK